MKKLLSFFPFITLCLCINIALGQTDQDTLLTTPLSPPTITSEIISIRKGAIIEREETPLDNMWDVSLALIKVKDLSNNEEGRSLKFEMPSGTGTPFQNFVDDEDVGGLLNMLEAIKNANATTKEKYTEIYYTTKGGFILGTYFGQNRKKTWTNFIKIDRYRSNSFRKLSDKDLTYLEDVFGYAKNYFEQ